MSAVEWWRAELSVVSHARRMTATGQLTAAACGRQVDWIAPDEIARLQDRCGYCSYHASRAQEPVQ